jgi:hypothetical protein
VANGAPRDAAMFDYVHNTAPYDCFFTPGAVRIAKILLGQYGAVEWASLLPGLIILGKLQA